MQNIHKKVPEKTLTIEEYPNLDLDGKDSKKINPALELIKAVCKVFNHKYRYVMTILRINRKQKLILTAGFISG